jgi:hypothetical protein
MARISRRSRFHRRSVTARTIGFSRFRGKPASYSLSRRFGEGSFSHHREDVAPTGSRRPASPGRRRSPTILDRPAPAWRRLRPASRSPRPIWQSSWQYPSPRSHAECQAASQVGGLPAAVGLHPLSGCWNCGCKLRWSWTGRRISGSPSENRRDLALSFTNADDREVKKTRRRCRRRSVDWVRCRLRRAFLSSRRAR